MLIVVLFQAWLHHGITRSDLACQPGD
jgi:hypothetical protein